jgi:DNA-binding transcriptional ArsR family regulator
VSADTSPDRVARGQSGLRALAHPLRLRMLSLLTGSSSSATELSRELGISQPLASYHLRQLHAAGVIELDEIRARRGGRERRFRCRPGARASTGDDAAIQEDHVLLGQAICVELQRRVSHAAKGATRLGVDAELWVDPADWQKALDAFKAASLALHERARPPRSAGTVRVSVSALLFTMSDEAGQADEPEPS